MGGRSMLVGVTLHPAPCLCGGGATLCASRQSRLAMCHWRHDTSGSFGGPMALWPLWPLVLALSFGPMALMGGLMAQGVLVLCTPSPVFPHTLFPVITHTPSPLLTHSPSPLFMPTDQVRHGVRRPVRP